LDRPESQQGLARSRELGYRGGVKCVWWAFVLHALIPQPAEGQRDAVLVVGAIGVAALADRGLNGWIQDHRSSGGDALARVFRNGGQPDVVFGIPGALLAAGVIGRSPALRRRGGRVLAAVVVAGLTTGAVKKAVGRLRPAVTNDPFLFKPFSDHDAFPSGHATMAFALATSLSEEIKNRWASAALYSFATGTAWSRINDRRHWLSDVVAGAAVGFTAAKVIERHPPRLLVDPGGARLEWRFSF
jgi:membrane-associated phospholipid phosphatase